MVKLTLIGTGGGRHTTMFQARSTGGFLLDSGKTRIHLDPGPGALTNLCNIGYDLRTTDAIMVSHCHPDHYSDGEVAVEGMTFGGWEKRGALYGSASVMNGANGLGPAFSPYHLALPKSSHIMKPGDKYTIGDMIVEITKANHSDSTTVGYKIQTPEGIVSYVTDTSYSDDIADQYAGSKLILLPITTPDGKRIKGHMCTDDGIKFLERIRPKLAIFIHLGIVMLESGPDAQAERTEKETGVRTVAGEDLMCIDVGSLEIEKIEPKRPEWNDAWELSVKE